MIVEPMISGDRWSLGFSDICLTVEEKPQTNSQPGKAIRPGIGETGDLWTPVGTDERETSGLQ